MATYSWDIKVLHTKDITKSGTTYSDVVLRVESELKGVSETIGSIDAVGTFDLDMDVDSIDTSFTAYDSVTKANVITWIESRIHSDTLAKVKSDIEAEIAFQEKINGSTAKGTTDSDDVFTATFPWD